jgi:hypothetical protein
MKVNVVIEAVFVGVFTAAIGWGVSQFTSGMLLLFTVGFVKHFLGGALGLHNWYCGRGVAPRFPVVESLLEGLLFVVVGMMLPLNFFASGIILHLLFELLGIHAAFCKKLN